MNALSPGPALVVDALSARYGGRSVLRELSPRPFEAGTLTALIGPNAAGKSTLLKAIAGLVRADGEVRLGDIAFGRLPLAQRARFVRFVPQAYQTQARLTVFDLLLVARMCGGIGRPSREDMIAVTSAIERTGIGPIADSMADALSGGQQQLVALAAALSRPAPVLLLDEPTSALDLRNQLEVFRIARRAADDGAVVIAALHDLNLAARHADRVTLMSGGAIVADGPPDAVLTTAQCGPAYGVELAHGRTSRGSLAIEAFLS
jgi:iron complex transport system ATP-binding protein